MKAVILAGGEGSRLRPLTCNLPKPLVPVCGKPVLFHILDLLAENGCTEAVIAVRYKGEKIENLLESGKYKGISLSFSRENKPLGTAGCVKKAADFSEDFLVISGDAVCAFELKAAMETHKKSGAAATIITKRVDDPREYGLIVGEKGKVKGFCEKPSYINCSSELANTGVYVLSPSVVDLIPADEMWDFAKNVFPEMLEKKLPLGYIEENGYWCDIGDISAYKRCNTDMLLGKVGSASAGRGRLTLGTDNKSCFYGRDAQLSLSAYISGNTVIGESVSIGDSTKLHNAIIMDGAYIGENVTLNDCIICSGAKIESGAAVYENAVVGENSVIGENAVICSGIRVWQDKQVPHGAFVNSDLKYGVKIPADITEDGISGETNTVITPEFAGRLGCALSKTTEGYIAAACSEEASSETLKSALLSGISSTGRQCFDCGNAALPVLAHTARLLNCDIIVHITAKTSARILIYNKGLLPLTRVQERLLENALNRGEYLSAGWNGFSRINRFTGSSALYRAMLDDLTDFEAPYDISLNCPDSYSAGIYSSYLKKISGGREKLTISLNERGTRSEITCGETSIDYCSMLLIAAIRTMSRGYDVALPFSFPQTADFAAESYGRRVLRYFASSMDDRDGAARRLAARQTFLHDGFVLALTVLKYLTESGLSPKEALKGIPRSQRARRFIHITCPPQKILGKIGASPAENEGAYIAADGERVFLRSNKRGTGLYLFAESFGAETAAELCDRTERLIKSAMKEIEG